MTVKKEWRSWLAVSALILLGSLSIIATYTKLSHTSDEPPHIAAGMQWWDEHRFTFEPLHPPLGRLMAASLLHFSGRALEVDGYSNGKPMYLWHAGINLLGTMPEYLHRLFLARLGVLPFFVLSCVLVFVWSRQLYGANAGLASLAIYVTLPTVLAHAGLATTDMAGACMLLAGIMASLYWLGKPTLAASILAGGALALMVASKFSNLLFWPCIMLAVTAANYIPGVTRAFHIRAQHFLLLPVVAIVFIAVIGAFYFYSYDELIAGINDLLRKNRKGHAVWLFEPLRNVGVWYFFPVVYFFKTPIAFLLSHVLAVRNAVKSARGNIAHLFAPLAALAIFLACMPSNINIGVRHVIVVYMLLSVPAGYAVIAFWRRHRHWGRALMALLLGVQLYDAAASFPDRISYFNQVAYLVTDGHPQRIAIDSDFDWGQQYLQLAEAIRERQITEIYGCFRFGGFQRRMEDTLGARYKGCPRDRITGWIAYAPGPWLRYPAISSWIEEYTPVQQVGNTLLLYYID